MIRTYEDATDDELMRSSADGDRKAFDVIVNRHGRFALRVAARLSHNPDVAEDVAQEAMVRAWTRAHTFNPRKARFSTWLYRIVVNLSIDHMRARRNDLWPENFDPPDPVAGAEEAMQETEIQTALDRALKTLPERQLAAMTLVYDEGLSGREAADILGISTKAVERLLSHARNTLKMHLQPQP